MSDISIFCFCSLLFVDKVEYTRKVSRSMKSSLQPILVKGLTEVAIRTGVLDALLAQSSTDGFTRHSCVWSNVPGFNEPIYLLGRKVVSVEASYCNVIPQIIMVSYDGFVYGTLATTLSRIKEPQRILDYMVLEIADELNQLEDSTSYKWPEVTLEAIDKLRTKYGSSSGTSSGYGDETKSPSTGSG